MARTIARTRVQKILASLAALGTCLALAATGTFAQATPVKTVIYGAGMDGFNPGMIISDEIFYNPNTMDAPAIQAFINSKGAGCVPGEVVNTPTPPAPTTEPTESDSGEPTAVPSATPTTTTSDPATETPTVTIVPCLKDFKMNTPTISGDKYCTGTYTGGSDENAGTIIDKIAKACSINPQVLLVVLQKEQSLLTATGSYLLPRRYRSAMGYGCPDTAECDAKYFGFFNQVYQAAHRFQYYRLNPEKFRHRAGKINSLLYHPKRDETGAYVCGTKDVFIENQATAGLYNYTPYTPNDAAIAAGADLGDSCSSYGNRNFYRFFHTWFGSTGVSASLVGSGRLEGAGRVETAISISAQAFPNGSSTAYLARADKPVDALVGGTLIDGPILLLPPNNVPQAVEGELNRLGATNVVALGGPASLSDAIVSQAANGRSWNRIFGPDRMATATAIASKVFAGKSVPAVYVAHAWGPTGQGSPDAVAAGALTDGPVLLVDPRNPASVAQVASVIAGFAPTTVFALGGQAALPENILKQLAGSATTGRLAGANRYETSVQIAQRAFPPQALNTDPSTGAPLLSSAVAYLARGDIFVDAVASGSLTAGPVLLVSPQSNLSNQVFNYIASLHPKSVIAIGGTKAVPGKLVDQGIKAVQNGLR